MRRVTERAKLCLVATLDMNFKETRLRGVFEIAITPHEDERGFFARSYCWREFEEHGLDPRVVQCNVSHNRERGTLRGMHYQEAPSPEAKLIRCVRGAVYDVAVDIRPHSATFREWIAVELKAERGKASTMLYLPEGVAHGFLTLEDDTEVFYQMSEFYAPDVARGFRWNDPAFSVDWPAPVRVISERDRTYPDFAVHRSQVGA
jgi:dTDP-4-dehydrorhamnose 3,5-epimerase